MKKSVISFEIELDDKNLPEKIKWNASDSQSKNNITKAIAVSLWDPNKNNTLKIDLWTKDMRVDEMDKFMIDTLGGLSQTMLNATGDTFVAESIDALCDKLVEHIKNKNYK